MKRPHEGRSEQPKTGWTLRRALLSGTFVSGTALTGAEALVYIAVGLLLLKPEGAPRPLAWRLFVAWWVLIGCNKMLSAAAGLGAAQGWMSTDAFIAILHVNFAILAVSLGCLMTYLLYLFTGSMASAKWVVLGYLGFYLLLTFNFVAGAPSGVTIGSWKATHTSTAKAPALVSLLVLLLLFVPQVVGASLYASLRRQLTVPAARYRVTLVPIAIVAWSVSILLVALPTFADSTAMQVGSRLMGATGALVALLAYRPPARIRERLEARRDPASA